MENLEEEIYLKMKTNIEELEKKKQKNMQNNM